MANIAGTTPPEGRSRSTGRCMPAYTPPSDALTQCLASHLQLETLGRGLDGRSSFDVIEHVEDLTLLDNFIAHPPSAAPERCGFAFRLSPHRASTTTRVARNATVKHSQVFQPEAHTANTRSSFESGKITATKEPHSGEERAGGGGDEKENRWKEREKKY
ncbi:hypothetical protein EYF80_017879 [Liparis tanakae]|uniref:Uncharacterized protein n=1 Tax=Liparis tanakae TaxID=230148 RepID=A0A4Z2I3M3_9TELE|nr:hypothetical protein EYF80_017879 [Liparis tanakae]